VEYRILGSLEVQHNGAAVVLGPPKQRAILALLLLHAGELVPTDRLIDLVWGESAPRTAAHSIQIYVSELRKEFERIGGGPLIETKPPGYVLHADPQTIDAKSFERLVLGGTRLLDEGDAAAATASIDEALGLWRGPALSDFAYEEFAQDEIRRLEALRVDALDASAVAELSLGHEAVALSSIQEAIAADPLRERSRELQLLALYRSGRRPEALRVYQEFRTLLSEELGVAPSPALQGLNDRILSHDPSDLGGEATRCCGLLRDRRLRARRTEPGHEVVRPRRGWSRAFDERLVHR
jgi:DNA-binding SARP family transcriptional activator